MTKKELIKQINKIANEMADLIIGIEELQRDARRIERALEDLPSEEMDIDDDSEDDNDDSNSNS